jgi:hypothetical protein
MLKTLLAAIGVAACAVASPAFASNAGEGYITSIMPMRNGVVIFDHSAVRSGATPACHGAGNGWTLNASTVAGQAQLSTLLSAQARGKKIVIIGLGNCSDWGDTEAANYFRVIE